MPKWIVFLIFVTGCADYSDGGKRDVHAMSIWAKRIRAECLVIGHGIDLSKDWNRTDVLRCPDGSINIVPEGI